jgi:hypothetical protein
MRGVIVAVLLAVAIAGTRPVVAAEVDADLRARLAAARTVRLVIEQSYVYKPRNLYRDESIDGYRMPFAAMARELLEGAGVRVVDAEASAFDATLAIAVTGRAIGRLYPPADIGYLYVGAEIDGEITFETSGFAAWRTPFFGRQQPPLEVSLNLGYDRPANAPFADVFVLPGSFVPRITRVIGTVFGPAPLITALETGRPALRVSAARALGDLGESGGGPGDDAVIDALVAALADADAELRRQAAWSLGRLGDPRATEPLKARLRDANADVRWFAAWALARITGASLDEMLAADDGDASRVE